MNGELGESDCLDGLEIQQGLACLFWLYGVLCREPFASDRDGFVSQSRSMILLLLSVGES